MFEKRINIFTGHFGSGKTEVAVNSAVKLASMGKKTAIVDVDIVNPFFRTADAKGPLEKKGIRVITPVYANTNTDVPALPPQVSLAFEDKSFWVVLDIGGDDLGAKVISKYRDDILRDDYEMYFVINTRRPETDTVEKIEEMIRSIEDSARMKVTSLVNNTNLLAATTAEVIGEGQKMIAEVSSKLGIPIGFISGYPDALGQSSVWQGTQVLPLERLVKWPWE